MGLEIIESLTKIKSMECWNWLTLVWFSRINSHLLVHSYFVMRIAIELMTWWTAAVCQILAGVLKYYKDRTRHRAWLFLHVVQDLAVGWTAKQIKGQVSSVCWLMIGGPILGMIIHSANQIPALWDAVSLPWGVDFAPPKQFHLQEESPARVCLLSCERWSWTSGTWVFWAIQELKVGRLKRDWLISRIFTFLLSNLKGQ